MALSLDWKLQCVPSRLMPEASFTICLSGNDGRQAERSQCLGYPSKRTSTHPMADQELRPSLLLPLFWRAATPIELPLIDIVERLSVVVAFNA